jgi:D-beta-D-heptose 7-phosphate kinase/D-beta-D-heptose 1-phosphate adenosyltransferase
LNFSHKSITIQPKVNSKKESGLTVDKPRIDKIFSHMGGNSIIIVGDLMMDRYLWGDVNRISPEAPVPVVEVRNETLLLGGAANVAVNIRKLEDEPYLIGVVGNDLRSETFNILLGDNGIRSDGIVMDNARPTTIKTRIIAHNQQVVRADHETTEDISRETEEEILAKIKAKISEAKGMIISDYGKGVITKKLLDSIISLCRENGIFIAVDPKDVNFKSYNKVSIITPNHHEAGFAYGKRIRNEDDLKEVGWGLLKLLDAESLLITRGPEGMALFEKSERLTFLPTAARKVYDVTGAGDTVISAIVSAIAAGANLPEAAYISNQAAGIVVGEVGTAQATKAALIKEINKRIKGNNDG